MPYYPSPGEFVRHPAFGLGFVLEEGISTYDAFFKDGVQGIGAEYLQPANEASLEEKFFIMMGLTLSLYHKRVR